MNVIIDKRGIKLLSILAESTEDAVVEIDSSLKLNGEPIVQIDEEGLGEKVFDILYYSSELCPYNSQLSVNEYSLRNMYKKLFPGVWEKVVQQLKDNEEEE